jgi:hypothetical protein
MVGMSSPPIRYVRSLADLGGLRVSVRQVAVAASALLLASSAAGVLREPRDTDVLRNIYPATARIVPPAGR